MNTNLNECLERVTDVKSYLDELYKLAENGNDYRVLDKFHYMVNSKLGIESHFYSLSETCVADKVTYCAHCGDYMHHNNMHRDIWYLYFEEEDEVYEIYYTPWEDDVDEYSDEYCINCERYEEE